MRILKTLAFLFICCNLLIGGVVSAAMPCCQARDMSQMHLEKGKSDTPCHQDSKKNNNFKNHNGCEKCKNCLNTSALISDHDNQAINFTHVNHNESVSRFISHQPSGIYSPPKHIS